MGALTFMNSLSFSEWISAGFEPALYGLSRKDHMILVCGPQSGHTPRVIALCLDEQTAQIIFNAIDCRKFCSSATLPATSGAERKGEHE